MAKTSVINRNKNRRATVARLKPVRDQLRKDRVNPNLTPEERQAAQLALQAQPRDACPSRVRRRCSSENCGRPRGNNRLTGTCRLHMRRITVSGQVPGMRKASW